MAAQGGGDDGAKKKKGEKRWFPLEANPAVMNKYCEKLGLKTEDFRFCDVLALEDWAFGMVSSIIYMFFLLFFIVFSSFIHCALLCGGGGGGLIPSLLRCAAVSNTIIK